MNQRIYLIERSYVVSWELMHTSEKPCKCGKGKLITKAYMDDWNRTKEEYVLDCEECQKKYVLKEVIKQACDGDTWTAIDYVER